MATSVATLKGWRKSEKSTRKTYQDRKKQVKAAYDNGFKMDDYYTKIKRKVEDCTSELNNGISGLSGILTTKCNSIDANKESQSLSSQYTYLNGLSYLASEINRCDNKISSCNSNIASYEKQIKDQGGIIYPWE